MEDPDWMNDFKTPTENVLLLSSSPSSSSSREVIRKTDDFFGTGEEVSQSNGKEGSDDEDSPLISVLRDGRAAKKGRKSGISGGGSSSSKKSPVKPAAKIVSKETVDDLEDDDDGHESPKISGLRQPRGKKRRALESEEEDEVENNHTPSKVRKTSSSPQVKKVGTARAAPKSGRKGRKVSFSDEEGTPQAKRVKREVQLEDSVTIEEDDEETRPISSLIKKKGGKPSAAATTSVSPSVSPTVVVDDPKLDAVSKGSRGASALASLRDSEGTTAADGDDALLTKEEINNEEETGEMSERKGKPRGSSNLPVLFADKVHRTKVLLECEGDALDLSGDMGAVGRFSVSSGKDNGEELFLDLKGIIYKATIVPSNTFFVVNVGHAEAKVEAIMNDFMQLRPDINQVEDETLVEGTLEGFGFDLYDEGEPLSTPVTASAPVDSDAEEDSKQKKKIQKPKKVASKSSKGSRTKGAGKQRGNGSSRSSRGTGREAKRRGKGATSKKPRAKTKATTKRPPKAKPAAAKSIKSKTT